MGSRHLPAPGTACHSTEHQRRLRMKRWMGWGTMIAFVLMTASAAYAEQTLELLTWKGYAPKELIDKFQKETGITVKPTYSNNEEMIAKLRATRGAGFDLAQPSQDRISSVQAEFGIYQPDRLCQARHRADHRLHAAGGKEEHRRRRQKAMPCPTSTAPPG